MIRSKEFIADACQQKVIDLQGGQHLVLAPPGCGKTQILTLRILKGHAQGYAYTDMLCLTFTNRAARGMKERIRATIADDDVEQVYVGNVHRFCSKFLFEHALIPAESSVIDEDDAISIIASTLRMDEDLVKVNYNLRRQYAEIIHFASFMYQVEHQHPKALRLHEECVNHNDIFAMRRICEIQKMPFDAKAMTDIYHHYDDYHDITRTDAYNFAAQQVIRPLLQKMRLAHLYSDYKAANKLIDFEDLLIRTYDALQSGAIEYHTYPWVEVDEVQDLNPMQVAIIDLLHGNTPHPLTPNTQLLTPNTQQITPNTQHPHPTIVYLGDEQQAIFSFMGAKMSTLDMLKERCKGSIHHLNVNHRSPQYLLEVFNTYAEEVLHIDKALLPSTNFVTKRDGKELQIISCTTVEHEITEVCNLAQRECINHRNDTTAIVVNANADADLISEELKRMHVPHFKVSGDDLFATPEVKVLIAHLNIIDNEFNFIAWSRLLKGLHVFETSTAARNFTQSARQVGLLPSDFIRYEKGSYLQDFIQTYSDRELVIFDTETTGLNVYEDDILQIAAVKMRRGKIVDGSQFTVFIASDREIPAKLGHIDNPIVEEMKHHTLLPHAEALSMFIDYVGDGMLLGHNADYDYHILDHNLRRYLPSVNLQQQHPQYFDSLKLIKLIKPELRQYKLKHLLEVLQLEGENSHLADADVAATCNVVSYCHDAAKEIVAQQKEFMKRKRVQETAEKLRQRYAGRFLTLQTSRYERSKEQQQPLATAELIDFYQYLIDEQYMQPVDKLPYLVNYLNTEVFDPTHELSLQEQLATHLVEINTLKEADLCSSRAISDRLFVTTIHKAKGLEFDNVVVFDAVEGRIPNYYNRDDPSKIAEDARKFYVAISRAKKRLYIAQSTVRIDYHNQPHNRQLTRFMTPILKYFTYG